MDHSTYFDVELFLSSASQRSLEGSKINDKEIIEKLCKKIDVVKHVYKFYSANLLVKESSIEISCEAYLTLMSILKYYAMTYLDYKYLNTSFKLNDIIYSKGLCDTEAYSNNYRELIEALNRGLEKGCK
ncbi:MAG: hypothetical protein ISEC1_P0826 [Thiomicrorhabdus sp.]|nr:MAG: hypothetical protein ISEC1_P0826 [Thiomicrorhabdus sp.]